MACLLLETRFRLSDFVLLRPEMLLLLAVILPILLLPTLRLGALSRMRRNVSTLLQSTSAILVVIALAEPALVFPDPHLSMVVVLDVFGQRQPFEQGGICTVCARHFAYGLCC